MSDEFVCRRLIVRHPEGKCSLTIEATKDAAGIWGESNGQQLFAIDIDQQNNSASIELWNSKSATVPQFAIGVGPSMEPTLQFATEGRLESVAISRLLEVALLQETPA